MESKQEMESKIEQEEKMESKPDYETGSDSEDESDEEEAVEKKASEERSELSEFYIASLVKKGRERRNKRLELAAEYEKIEKFYTASSLCLLVNSKIIEVEQKFSVPIKRFSQLFIRKLVFDILAIQDKECTEDELKVKADLSTISLYTGVADYKIMYALADMVVCEGRLNSQRVHRLLMDLAQKKLPKQMPLHDDSSNLHSSKEITFDKDCIERCLELIETQEEIAQKYGVSVQAFSYFKGEDGNYVIPKLQWDEGALKKFLGMYCDGVYDDYEDYDEDTDDSDDEDEEQQEAKVGQKRKERSEDGDEEEDDEEAGDEDEEKDNFPKFPEAENWTKFVEAVKAFIEEQVQYRRVTEECLSTYVYHHNTVKLHENCVKRRKNDEQGYLMPMENFVAMMKSKEVLPCGDIYFTHLYAYTLKNAQIFFKKFMKKKGLGEFCNIKIQLLLQQFISDDGGREEIRFVSHDDKVCYNL